MSEIRWSIFVRAKSPYFQVRIIWPDDRQITKSTKKTTETEAKAWAAEYVQEIAWRERLGFSGQTKSIDFVYDQMVKSLPESKRNYYRSSWRNHIEPSFGGRDVDTLKTQEVKKFLQGLNLSGSRIAAIGVVLRKIIRHAIDEDWIKEGQAPKVPATTYRSGKRGAFTDDEMKTLLAGLQADRDGGYRRTDKDSRRLLYYYVAFLYHTGARPGVEMEKLRWMDIQEDKRGSKTFLRINIRPEATKVRREREVVSEAKLVPIYRELIEIQKEWGNYKPTSFVFADSRGIVRRFSNEIFRRALIRLGMLTTADGRERSMYWIRHQKITKWVRDGKPLPSIALQSGNSPAMVYNVYSKAVAADFIDSYIGED